MRTNLKHAIHLSFIIFACTSSENQYPGTPSPAISEETLVIKQQIGETLDTMIYNVKDVSGHPEYSMIILDSMGLNVHCLRDNNLQEIFCRSGEGPGELFYPLSIAALGDGRFLVADESKHEVMIYSILGEYLGPYLTTEWYVPSNMLYVDSSLVCSLVGLDYSTGQPEYTYSIGRYLEGQSIPEFVYREMRWEWTSAEFYTDIGSFDFTASDGGLVYIVDDISVYSIAVYQRDGQLINTIERPDVLQLEKTREVIDEETAEFELWAQQDEGYMGGYQPSPNYPLIQLSGVDRDGNLWVRRLSPFESVIDFDVYDMDGNLFANISFPMEDPDCSLTIKVDIYGIYAIATDEFDNQFVYLLEIDEGV